MKKGISYWFLLGLAVWIAVLLLRKYGVYIPVINGHCTDLISVPMYCYLIEYLMNNTMGYQWKPDLKFVLTSCVYLSFLFEILCPRLSDVFTGDVLDVLAYFAGGMAYYYMQKRMKSKPHLNE
ncbi:hypothetical protein [Chryseobacterium gallinarum]|uniref:VanZ-like domain-containing protein n=1 Tax=Chryseobacterium gallinarum TaxID=1324352 RepID=A0ABX6KVB8_CHRGL|nr:hypothetical protein [Chryseobacterium gallinarum]QIY92542.1 hypothetical protein FOB44_18620 [Chryseobacterium gallinarum]